MKLRMKQVRQQEIENDKKMAIINRQIREHKQLQERLKGKTIFDIDENKDKMGDDADVGENLDSKTLDTGSDEKKEKPKSLNSVITKLVGMINDEGKRLKKKSTDNKEQNSAFKDFENEKDEKKTEKKKSGEGIQVSENNSLKLYWNHEVRHCVMRLVCLLVCITIPTTHLIYSYCTW